MGGVIGGNNVGSGTAFQRFRMYIVGIIIVEDHEIGIARDGGGRKTASLIRLQFTGDIVQVDK